MCDGSGPANATPVNEWKPQFPAGEMRAVVLHWTAGDYHTVYPAYHYCVTGGADVRIAATSDLRANMRDVRGGGDYAAHTAGRNSYAAGIAICAMRAATPYDFGAYPLTREQLDGLCIVAAALVRFYDIALQAVRTHAEAALDDGYFGAGADDERWDIARFEAAAKPLGPVDARAAGDWLRAQIATRCRRPQV